MDSDTLTKFDASRKPVARVYEQELRATYRLCASTNPHDQRVGYTEMISHATKLVSRRFWRVARLLGEAEARESIDHAVTKFVSYYDPTRPASPLLATICHRALSQCIVRHRRLKQRSFTLDSCSGARVVSPSTGEIVGWDTLLPDHYDDRELVDTRDALTWTFHRVRDLLTDWEMAAFILFEIHGYSYFACAAIMVSWGMIDAQCNGVKIVDNAITRTRMKLKKLDLTLP